MNLDNLFVIENDVPYLNKEARNIKSFYDIIVRDKGVQTKVDGENQRVKTVARKEIAFVYFYANPDLFNNYNQGKEREDAIKRRLNIDWEIDNVVRKAIEEVSIDIVPLQQRLVNEVRTTLFDYIELMGFFRVKNADTRRRLMEFSEMEDLTLQQIADRNELIKASFSEIGELQKFTKELKASYKDLEELEVQARSGTRRRKSDSNQDPKNAIFKKKPLE